MGAFDGTVWEAGVRLVSLSRGCAGLLPALATSRPQRSMRAAEYLENVSRVLLAAAGELDAAAPDAAEVRLDDLAAFEGALDGVLGEGVDALARDHFRRGILALRCNPIHVRSSAERAELVSLLKRTAAQLKALGQFLKLA